MTNRKQLMCFAAFTALTALSAVSHADDYAYPVANLSNAHFESSGPMTCSQAKQFTWFKHQMEITDGSFDNAVEVPAECQREILAGGEAPAESTDTAVAEGE